MPTLVPQTVWPTLVGNWHPGWPHFWANSCKRRSREHITFNLFPPLQIFLASVVFSLPALWICLNAMNFRHVQLFMNYCSLLAWGWHISLCRCRGWRFPCLFSFTTHPNSSSLCNNGCHSKFNLIIYIQHSSTVYLFHFYDKRFFLHNFLKDISLLLIQAVIHVVFILLLYFHFSFTFTFLLILIKMF